MSGTARVSSKSILEILSPDSIGNILSYSPLSTNIKCVNKEFNKLSAQCEKQYYSNLQKRLDKDSPIPYNSKANKTWIIHPKRSQLTAPEKKHKFNGPFRSLSQTLLKCKSGDRLFIHHGVKNGAYRTCASINKNLTIVGVGSASTVISGKFAQISRVAPQKEAYFENITFDCRGCPYSRVGAITIDGGKLWLNKCKFLFTHIGIFVKPHSHLNARSCKFYGGTSAITISPYAEKINIKNSIFKHCEDVCVQIAGLKDRQDTARLFCAGNVFENNWGYPIADSAKALNDYLSTYIRQTELYTLTGNILRGYNGSNLRERGHITDANKIYFDDQPWEHFFA